MVYIMQPIESLSPALLYPVTIVIKRIFVSIKLFLIFLIGIIVFSLRLFVSPAHTKGALRSDQQNQAAAPAAIHPTILRSPPSVMLMKSPQRQRNPHSPAKRVSKRLPKKPMTFRKVLDTIDSISENLCIVKLDDVYSFVPMGHRREILFQCIFQSPALVCRNCRP